MKIQNASAPGAPFRARQFLSDLIDAGVAALNGIAGDFLAGQKSVTAIRMEFYHDKKPLPMEEEAISSAHPNAGSRVVIFVHGLCCNERIWHFANQPKKTYGSLLQRDLGYTPFYVRYNSGLHVSENGKILSCLIESLVKAYPVSIRQLILIGHSKGGLVLRSACHYGRSNEWTRLVRRTFFLGTPFLGAPLEKAANAVTFGLRATKFSIARTIADFINLRSSAIKDLCFGYTIDEEWKDSDPDALLQNNRRAVPLLPGSSHYLVAASLSKNPGHFTTQCLGDILVRVPSALGAMPYTHGWPGGIAQMRIFPATNHFALPRHSRVYWQIKDWCQAGRL